MPPAANIPSPAAVVLVVGCERAVLVPDDLFGLVAGGGQPSRLGQVSLAGPVVAGQLTGLLGELPPDRVQPGIWVLDLRLPQRPEPGPEQLAPPRRLVVALHASRHLLLGHMAVALDGDAGDELGHPAPGQAEPFGHGPLAQRLPGRDRRRVGCADRLLHIARYLWRGWPAGGRAWPAGAAHELHGDLDRADERHRGPGRDQPPSSPYPDP